MIDDLDTIYSTPSCVNRVLCVTCVHRCVSRGHFSCRVPCVTRVHRCVSRGHFSCRVLCVTRVHRCVSRGHFSCRVLCVTCVHRCVSRGHFSCRVLCVTCVLSRVQGPLLLPCPVRDVCPVTCPGATSLAVSCA